MTKLKVYVAVLLFLLVIPQRSRAAIQFDPFIGYEGTIHEGGWFPITCEVFNDGPSFNAVIEIAATGFGTDQIRQIPVELPTNTRKRVVIPVFASGARWGNSSWEARLKDSSGKEIIKVPPFQTKIVAWESTIMAAIPRTFGGTPAFPQIKNTRNDLKPEVARITVDQFPDNPIALEGLNAIYLNSEKALDLKVNQVTALLGWVRSGGHLIVAVEQTADVNGTPWLKQFAPIDLADTTNIKIDQELAAWVRNEPSANTDIDSVSRVNRSRPRRNTPQQGGVSAYSNIPNETVFKDAELPIATGQVKDGFTFVSSQNHPLVVQAPRGRGKITLLTFSPEREPFRSWKSRDLFWAKLCGIPGEFFTSDNNNGYGGNNIDGVFGALIDSRQIKKLPVTWLLLLLVVYLVVIGPFDQWWLKKINKQMLTWITFPSYVVLFSLLIYFIGYKLRAGETEWNELNIVDVLPRGDKVDLRGRTYISIYSSGNTRYSLAGQQGYATLRGESMENGTRESTKGRFVQQGNTFKAEVEGLVWTSSLYANEWFKTNDTPFIASVTDTGADYQVEIENLLNKPLTDLRLVANQLIFDMENIGPKEKKTIRLNPSKGTALRSFVQQNGAYFVQAVERRRNPLGDTAGGQLEDRPLTATTASFISQLDELRAGRTFICPAGFDLTPQVERGDAVIFAYIPNFAFTEKVNQFDPPRYRRDTLMRLSIPLRQKNSI